MRFTYVYARAGVVCIFGVRKVSMQSEQGGRLRGKRVLVVEDELMIRMLLEDMLAELGYVVAGTAMRIGEGVDAARTKQFDIAILDINLEGQPSSPVAEVLVARGAPFFFVTGYGHRGVPEQYRNYPMLKKPFQIETLKDMLHQLLQA
jgi:CheY-like chemotaxis protein